MAEEHRDSGHGGGRFDKEISYRAVLWFMIVLTLITVLTFVGLWFAGIDLRDRLAASDPPAPPLAEARQTQVPAGPLLQTHPYRDLVVMEAREDSVLHAYAWIDRDRGIVRIPLDAAIERVAAEGLPVFPATPAAPDAASDAP